MDKESSAIVFLPGKLPSNPGPLGRFLPPLPDESAQNWLAQYLSPGAWVLDPFGASPRLAAAIARAGYRLLVTAHNPIERFLIELFARPLAEEELRAALADLATAPIGDERLEAHIRNLYRTECVQCSREVMAEAFLWERDAPAPFARIYHCPHCLDHGEHPATQADAARAARFATGGMHHARALERVARIGDPDRVHAKEALDTYPPRAVFALFTLINKLDSLAPQRRRALSALLLAALDQTNALWPYPTTRARPRLLTVPPRFREKNVWLALEEAVIQWPSCIPTGSTQVPLTRWPELPPESGGICLFEGPLRELVEHLQTGFLPDQSPPGLTVQAAFGTIPRPNQAYWTLSALWAGWLWGPEATAPFKSVLRRRRYDWAWHTTALHAACHHLFEVLSPGASFLGLVGEAEPGFLGAAILAAALAGFTQEGVALRLESGQAQLGWQRAPTQINGRTATKPATPEEVAQRSAQEHLLECGEPANYLHVYTATIRAIANAGNLPVAQPAEAYEQIQEIIQRTLFETTAFTHWGGSERNPESSLWWPTEHGLKDAGLSAAGRHSLADQVEMFLVRYLQKQSDRSTEDIERELCKHLTGLFTPEPELMNACLVSYGEQEKSNGGGWRLRPQDEPAQRRADLANVRSLLAQTGHRLGYQVNDPGGLDSSPIQHPIVWQDEQGTIEYIFYVLASAVFSKIIFPIDQLQRAVSAGPGSPSRNLLVVPGGRASLVDFKLRRDPRLNEAVQEGWRFLKFRHVRRLAESDRLGRENLDEQLDLDPLANTDPQITFW